ncbi:MAG: zinc ribbon domain-containing protein [Lentisphaerae bacterium]|nr:zinc ribbon domain-containing protein [Lentisphaerota bacterium]
MPIYEYKCDKCGKIFEHLAQRASDPAPKCPKCGAKRPKKMLSTFNAGTSAGWTNASCSTGTCPTGTCPLA